MPHDINQEVDILSLPIDRQIDLYVEELLVGDDLLDTPIIRTIVRDLVLLSIGELSSSNTLGFSIYSLRKLGNKEGAPKISSISTSVATILNYGY